MKQEIEINQEKGVSLLQNGVRRLKKDRLAMGGLFVLLLLAAVSLFAPLLAPYGRDVQDLTAAFAGNR